MASDAPMIGDSYVVAAELTLKSNIPAVMREIVDGLTKARAGVSALQEAFDKLGLAGKGVSAAVRSLQKLQDIRFPAGLATGASDLEAKLSGAVGKMDALLDRARALGTTMGGVRPPVVPGGGGGVPGRGGGGGHGGGRGDPIMEGLAGVGTLDWFAHNYEDYARVEQTYRGFQSDSRLAGNSPAMAAMRAQAAGQLDKYRVLTPLDVARNAGEAFTLGGGNMGEQAAIADMLDRVEQNLIARNPKMDVDDAQRQAVSMLRGLDVANRFFDPKTGEFSTTRANAEVDRVQALLAASNGLATGQNFLAFEKSAKLAGQRLSLEGEARLAHYIDINPSRSGTALNSFEALFGGHASRMKAADKQFWTRQGIYGKDGRIVDADTFASDPLLWIQKHMSGVNVEQITDRTQRQTVSGLLAETQGAAGNINRQAAATARQNVDGNTGNALDSPAGKMLTFGASLDRFRVSLGKFEAGPGSKILDELTKSLDRMTTFLDAHPTFAKGLIDLAGGLAVLGVARGVLALTGVGSGLGALGRGLATLAKGTAGGEALAVLGAGAGVGSLAATAAGFVAVAGALALLPPLMNWLAHLGPVNTTHPMSANRGHAGPLTPAGDVSTPASRGNYHPAAGDVHVTVNVDGKQVAAQVTKHVTSSLAGGIHYGSVSWDPMSTPLPAGVVVP